MPKNSKHIVFICQPGELEIKALLLAYSLKKNNYVDKSVYIPSHLIDKLSIETERLFKVLDTEIVLFENDFIVNRNSIQKGDWMSNKFFALKKTDDKDAVLFLDSDMINLRPHSEAEHQSVFAAKPADRSSKVNWPVLFAKAGINYLGRTTQTTIDKVISPPYFNAGFLEIGQSIKAPLIEKWQKYFLWLSDEKMMQSGFFDVFHRDQIALSLALVDLKIDFTELSEEFNYPARLKEQIPDSTVFAHYHDCYTIKKHLSLFSILEQFTQDFPEFKSILYHRIPWRFMVTKQYALLLLYKNYQKTKAKVKRLLFA